MELKHVLRELFDISAEESEVIQSKFRPEVLPKNAYFLRQNERCTKLSFMESGLVRVFAHAENKEVTQWLGGPRYFITDLSSFVFRQPARWNIRMLADTKLWTLSQADYLQFERELPQWNIIEKRFIAKCFAMLEQRIFDFISLSAEERYHQFFKENAEMLNQVPLQYVASMLGMTPETLSRIRAK